MQKIVPSTEVTLCFTALRRARAGFSSFIPAFDTSLLGDIGGIWVPVPGWTITKI